MSYATDHANALATIAEKGQRITFSRTTRAHDENTGAPLEPVTVAVSGYALGLERGDPSTYARLGLTLSAAPSIMVVCDTYGEVPPDNATCVFGGVAHTVADVAPFAPDGTPIFSTCVIAR